MKVYEKISHCLSAMDNCAKSGNTEWMEKHEETIHDVIDRYLMHGSGFDNGTKLDFDKSTPEKLFFVAPFHHMDQNGFYCGWSDHVFRVTPSLQFGFNVKISNPDRAKSWDMVYFYDTFCYLINKDVE